YGDNLTENRCLVSEGGEDQLFGQRGDDLLIGQLASDTYHFDPAPAAGSGDERDTVLELLGAGTEARTDEGIHDRLDFSSLGNNEPVIVDLSGTPPFAVPNQIAEHSRLDGSSDAHLVITAGAGQFLHFEELIGGAANDRLIGNAGNNLFDGGLGSDFMQGGAGDDTYLFIIGNPTDNDTLVETIGSDTIDFRRINVPVIADLSGSHAGWTPNQIAEYAGLTVESPVPDLFENITGGTANDELTGNETDNVLIGGLGTDSINGKGGKDRLDGGADNDHYIFEDNWGDDLVVESPNGGAEDVFDFQLVSADLTFLVGTNFIDVSDGTNHARHNGTTTNHIERIEGGTGNNTLVAAETSNTWIITGENEGTINGVFFTGIANLVGGSDTDTFVFEPSGRITGDILSGDGDDLVDLRVGLGIDGTFDAGFGNDQLLGPTATPTTYQVTALDQGNITNLIGGFQQLENILAGDEADTFNFTGDLLSGSIDGGAGNDTFNIRAASVTTLIQAGPGDDTIVVSSDAPASNGNLDAIASLLLIDGGDDNDSLILSDTGGTSANVNVVITNAKVAGLAGAADDVDVNYATIESLTINGNSNDENFDVQSTSAATNIDAGAGNDTFHVSSDAPTDTGSLDAIIATLTITGGDDDDSLILSDAGGATANANVVITDAKVAGMAGPADDVDVDYASIESLTIIGNNNDETFDVQ
ncbi:MAG: hypothetical protein KDA99_20970, partial [Planctomycetales bacterium]|nr:hypothetical protein [Planctomycetales bacterium]